MHALCTAASVQLTSHCVTAATAHLAGSQRPEHTLNVNTSAGTYRGHIWVLNASCLLKLAVVSACAS
jgi:hypothetical protein